MQALYVSSKRQKALPQTIRLLRENSGATCAILAYQFLVSRVPGTPGTLKVVTVISCMPELDIKPCCTLYFGCRIWRNQAGIELEASSLLTGFHHARRCPVFCRLLQEKCHSFAIIRTLHAIAPICWEKLGPSMEQYYNQYGYNQLISNQI